tara:strand:+ start:1927 stop:2766 length:840 start_codon:yes stop_codon:yes gene_type:complete
MALTKVTSGVRTLATGEVETANIADSNVTTAKLADDAVTAAKLADDAVGLAALAPQTDGSLISFDASTNPTLISPGTSGHVLTSAGAGAVPSFQAPSSGIELLQSVTASNNTTITVGSAGGSNHFSNSAYKKFLIHAYDVDLTADSFFKMNFGTGTTPTIDETSSYGWAINQYNTNAASASYTNADGNSTEIRLMSSQQDAASPTDASFHVELINPSNADQFTMCTGWAMFGSINLDDFHRSLFFGVYEEITAITAVRFSLESGSFETGEFRLYGVKDS